MLALRTPTPDSIGRFLARQAVAEFSYSEVGATAGELPSGYAINHARRHLGHGRAAFEAACRALRGWHQLRLGWVDCWPHDAPVQAGVEIAVIGRALGLYWLNACRIAYVIDERAAEPRPNADGQDTCQRYGYAQGTLPDHLAVGEERFLIEMNSVGRVSIDILSFSKPNTLLAKLGCPLIRRSQQRFLLQSTNRLEQYVIQQLSTAICEEKRELAFELYPPQQQLIHRS